jgi:hypothetical protein
VLYDAWKVTNGLSFSDDEQSTALTSCIQPQDWARCPEFLAATISYELVSSRKFPQAQTVGSMTAMAGIG